MIPVLAYHKVGAPVRCRSDHFLNVPTTTFRRQMRLLARLGYRAVTFADVVAANEGRLSLPRRAFAVTFDDGYANIAEMAAPILEELGFPATVYAVSQRIGMTNAWDRAHNKPELPLMDWPDLSRLAALGWEIGGHTRTHPALDTLDAEDALCEIAAAKAEIEARLGITQTTFCYPYGRLNAHTPALVRAAGFSGACTTRSGMTTLHCDPFVLPRVKVAYHDGAIGLLYRLLVRPMMPTMRLHRPSYSIARPSGYLTNEQLTEQNL